MNLHAHEGGPRASRSCSTSTKAAKFTTGQRPYVTDGSRSGESDLGERVQGLAAVLGPRVKAIPSGSTTSRRDRLSIARPGSCTVGPVPPATDHGRAMRVGSRGRGFLGDPVSSPSQTLSGLTWGTWLLLPE
jgi:hypothetical protein